MISDCEASLLRISQIQLRRKEGHFHQITHLGYGAVIRYLLPYNQS